MSKQIIYDFLIERIGNPVGVCALMGNLYVESKLEPGYLESSKAKKMGLTASEYTIKVNSGENDRETFSHDGAGYGLAQWTYWSRKQGLYDFSKSNGNKIGNLQMQLEYLWDEIQKYKSVINALYNASDLREVSDVVALRYLKPANTEEKYLQNRANYGRKYYDEFVIKMEGKEDAEIMNSASYVDEQIVIIKNKGIPLADEVWEAALLCIGWPYIFGDRGTYCTPAHRQAVHNSHPDQSGLIDKCKVLKSGAANCSGCKWYPGGKKVRAFDCRGYTYWCLLQFGIKIMGVGATAQWNDDSNWESKGTIDTIPEDKLVCLFYREKEDPKKMAHTGLGYHGETLECSNGVQHFTKRDKKWEYWAIPKGLYDSGTTPTPTRPTTDTDVKMPTLRKGDRGQYVTLLQTLLLNRGYELPKYGADGDFGNETLAAVKRFQQDWGLTVDGIVGSKTWGYLESSMERQKLYTVTIPHLTKAQAEEVLKPYTGTMVLENG